jgi:hypothetical protein
MKGIVFLSCFCLLLSVSCKNNQSISYNKIEDKPYKEVLVKGTPISPILVGTNVWYINPSEQVWDLTQQSGVKCIRIGGHAYDVKMPSKEQLIDWVNKIQSIGAEPIMQVSQYNDPKEAEALVKLFNVDLVTGKPIKFWNIGNEPWLQNGKPELSKVGPMVEAYFKPRAEVMKAVDPTIKIYGPDLCYYIDEAMNDLFGGKNDISGKIPGKNYYYSDGISWHRYPQDTNINLAYEGIEDFKASIIKCKAKVDSVNVMHNRTGDSALSWGIGEYNAKGGPQVHTWENGQMFGGVLDLCMKYEATYAATWSMFEHNGDRVGSDFSFIDGTNMVPRPSYRHMQMIANSFSGVYVEGKSSLDDVITFGSVDGNKISVMIMNRSKKPITYNLNLNYNKVLNNANHINLNIDAKSEISNTGTIDALATQTLVFENNEVIKTNYSNNSFQNELPIEVTKNNIN